MEHQVPFIQALRSGRNMRKRMFDTIEQRHTHDFVSGTVGTALYANLLSAVRLSGAPEAVEEFESRFFPLLNSDQTRGDADVGAQEEMAQHGPTEMPNRRRGGWVGISALCLVAFVTALIVGFNAMRMTASERPGFKELTITAAKPTAPASETMSEPTQEVAAQAPISAMDVTDPTSETRTEPVPATSAEEKLTDD